jgi:hypothetical protein
VIERGVGKFFLRGFGTRFERRLPYLSVIPEPNTRRDTSAQNRNREKHYEEPSSLNQYDSKACCLQRGGARRHETDLLAR